MLRSCLVLSLSIALSGCFGSCNGDQEFYPEAGCADLDPAADITLVVGRHEGETFEELESGATLQMDYGLQGGQHVYYSVRVFGAVEGDVVTADLSPGGSGRSVEFLEVCEGGWSELLNAYVQLDKAEEISTELSVRLLRCPVKDGCDYYDEGAGGAAPETLAEIRTPIKAVP
jgi:hypothetical protein